MEFRHIQVTPLTPTIGAMIEGVDLNDVGSEDVYDEIRDAVWRHHVVFFRDQPITPEAHIALGERFGELTAHEFFPTVDDGNRVQLEVRTKSGATATTGVSYSQLHPRSICELTVARTEENDMAGHQAIAGSRIPPSQVPPLAPRSRPAEPPSSFLVTQGPLSLVKKTKVFSANSCSRIISRICI